MTPIRRALRAQLAAQRQQLARRLATLPAAVLLRARRRRRTRRRLAGGLLVLGLLLLLWRCPQVPPVPPDPPAVPPAVGQGVSKTPPSGGPPPVSDRAVERIQSVPRATFAIAPQPAPTWLDGFRMQVVARSPRLAQCFQGQDAPGALRWTSSVVPGTGRTSDHVFEPLGAAPLAGREACLREVLSTPPFQAVRDPNGADPSTPIRVSIVIEF